MSLPALLGGLAGGVGLFLLGMGLMTDGLKLAAGQALERILARSTKTRLRGLASGIMVTALVQSSSAVTVAAIGFVNAGLLNLSQALWVLFGANVGTTMTGWLVALVGLKFKIEVLALPLIGFGMILRLTGEGHRRGAMGTALAGFGVLFLGIDMLKETFSVLSGDFVLPAGDGVFDVLARVLMGIVLTVLMQSSSAALAVALTAAQGGLLTAQGAAAVVIGSNIGTTFTGLIAAIGATSNARRAAAAHIFFNLLTGAVALALLPWLVRAIEALRDTLGMDSAPAATLALFHTVFNVLGVLLMWPLARRLTAFLQDRFRSADEDEARPRHLDKTALAVPALALDALYGEVRHMGGIALHMLRAALAPPEGRTENLNRHRRAVVALNQAIAEFIAQLNRARMSGDSARRLPEILRLARYYETAAELAVEATEAAGESAADLHGNTVQAGARETEFRQRVSSLIDRTDPSGRLADSAIRDAALRDMETAYLTLKAALLEAGARSELPLARMDAHLRAARALRRAAEQSAKAARMLAEPPPHAAP